MQGAASVPRPAAYVARATGLAIAAAAIGVLFGLALRRVELPLGLVLAGGVGMLGTLALTLSRPDAAVGLGFGLLGVVAADPAPPDGVFFLIMLVAVVAGSFRLHRAPVIPVAILGTFLFLNLVSSVGVTDGGRAAGFFGITLFLVAFGLWLSTYVDRSRRARVVLRGYLVAAVGSAILGTLALFVPIPGHELFTEDARARALFQDPNVFGPFLVPAALMVTEELVAPRLLRSRTPTKLVLLVVLVLGVVLSYSRGAWLNLAVGLIVMTAILAARTGGARKAATLVAAALVAAAAIATVIVATGSTDFLAERARPQAYDTQRFGGQRAGIELALRYPFGTGPGQFESAVGISAHSSYVRVVAEQGLLGVLTLLIFLLLTAAAGLRNAILGRGTYGIGSAALLGAWMGILANSFFIDTLHWRHMWVVAALIWAGWMRAVAGPPALARHGARTAAR